MNLVLHHNFWTLNLKNSLYSSTEGQQLWTFMGSNIRPIVMKGSFDVHDEDDIRHMEKRSREEGIRY